MGELAGDHWRCVQLLVKSYLSYFERPPGDIPRTHGAPNPVSATALSQGSAVKKRCGWQASIISGSMLAAAGQRRAGRTPRSVPLCCRHILRSHGAVQESLPHGATQHTHDWCFVKSHDWCFLNRLDAAKRNLAGLGPLVERSPPCVILRLGTTR